MIKSASEFLALASLKRSTVKVRGKEVNIRELSVAEREKMLRLARADKDSAATDSQVFLLRNCVIDADGKPLFTDAQAADLAGSAPDVCDAVATAIMQMSGLGDDSKNA